jgi:hypothetical protein
VADQGALDAIMSVGDVITRAVLKTIPVACVIPDLIATAPGRYRAAAR